MIEKPCVNLGKKVIIKVNAWLERRTAGIVPPKLEPALEKVGERE